MSPKKLNILFLNSIEASTWGGLENWMELVGTGLAARGHRVTVYGRPHSEFIRQLSRHEKLEVVGVNLSGDFNPLTIMHLAQKIKSGNFDFVLCNFVRDVRLAGLAREFTYDFKIVWTPGVNLAKKTLSHKFLFSGFVDQVIVPSRHLRDQIMMSGYLKPSLFHIIPIGLDKNHWTMDKARCRREIINEFDLPENSFICLTSGRFVPQKGHKYLIEAAVSLCSKNPNIRFVLLGGGPLENEMKSAIAQYGLEKYFVFAGMLEDHRPVVFGADLYVHPAVIEPYGIVLVEAMAAGLPVITTRVGGIPEVVSEDRTAILVDPADPVQLTNAIETVYNNENLRARLGEAGRERFKAKFALEEMIDRVERLLLG